MEARARIDSLSDAEVIQLGDRIDRLPAGGNGLLGDPAIGTPAWLVPAVIIGAVLIIAAIVGVIYQAINAENTGDEEKNGN